MDNSVKYSRVIMITLNIIFLSLCSIIYWNIWIQFFKYDIVEPFYSKGTMLLVLVYALILLFFTVFYGGYRIKFNRITEIIFSQILALILTNTITYLQISLIAREMLNIFPIVLMTLGQVLVAVIWANLTNVVYFKLHRPMKLMVISGGNDNSEILLKFRSRQDRYIIDKFVEVSGSIGDAIMEIEKSEVDGIVIIGLDSGKCDKIIQICYEREIRIFLVPKISDILLNGADKLHIFDTPLVVMENTGISLENEIFKRILDVSGSLVFIILLLPVMIVTAVCIKIEDGGSIIYKQKRLTKGEKEFEIYKFRSMIENAEDGGKPRLSVHNDNRVTRVGKVIRRFKIDELPQLFNVLNGEMSLVGPRPERAELAEKYTENMPEFGYRTRVKAGMTGYGQIMGKYSTSPQDKLKLDLMYIENYSLALDFKLILMTLKIIFKPDKQ